MVQLYSRVSRSLALPISKMPSFIIPLSDKLDSSIGGMPATFLRNSTATYIDDSDLVQTAGIDVIRFQNGRYLCELGATNRFLQSGTPATQVITVVSGTVYTIQCYGAGSITLSGAGTGTVVEGTPITFTASSTSLTCTVSGSLNRAQVETGTKATSYIPTTTTPITRAADSLNYAVGDVITQGHGSLYCEFIYSYTTGFPRVLELYADASNEIIVRVHSSKVLGAYVVTGGTNSTILSTPLAIQDLTLYKICVVYTANDFRFYVNGLLIGQVSQVTIPNFSALAVGMTRLSASQLNGEIGNIKYFKEVLTPEEAIKITTL